MGKDGLSLWLCLPRRRCGVRLRLLYLFFVVAAGLVIESLHFCLMTPVTLLFHPSGKFSLQSDHGLGVPWLLSNVNQFPWIGFKMVKLNLWTPPVTLGLPRRKFVAPLSLLTP